MACSSVVERDERLVVASGDCSGGKKAALRGDVKDESKVELKAVHLAVAMVVLRVDRLAGFEAVHLVANNSRRRVEQDVTVC